MFRLPLPADARQYLRAKLGDALHAVSALHLAEHDRRKAWARHMESLAQPGGWRYALYTRYLLGWPSHRAPDARASGRRRDNPAQRRP
jgi:23S rRNA C2498 (ribose-2'-O)-methylase RlmM